jgi:hypothetical protein
MVQDLVLGHRADDDDNGGLGRNDRNEQNRQYRGRGLTALSLEKGGGLWESVLDARLAWRKYLHVRGEERISKGD